MTPPLEPPFWNAEIEQIPWCRELRAQHGAIWQELQQLIRYGQPFRAFPQYGLYSHYWEAFPLSVFEGEFNGNLPTGVDLVAMTAQIRQHLPVLSALIAPLERQGHLRNGFVSRLLPGSVIHPHRGWTSDYLRVHLGLVTDPQCCITVGPETQTWHPGQLLAFKDGGPYMHSVVHRGTGERIIASFDLRISYVSQFVKINIK